jgi:hypothetical protein
VNCCVGIGNSSCLGGDVEGVRVGVEDRLATGDGVVLMLVFYFYFHIRKWNYYFPLPLFSCSLLK